MKISNRFAVILVLIISTLSGILLVYDESLAFAFEENILVLKTGIISTSSQDYAISQEFDAKIFQNGMIMRLSGITTTGEQYYLYQKEVGGETFVKGKIFVNNAFLPIIFNDELLEQPTIESETQIAMAVKLSDYTYSGYPFVISVKVFDTKINQKPRYDSRIGIVEDVLVNVKISDRFDNHVTTLSGNTDSTGVFRDTYLVLENTVDQGKYNVEVTIDDGNVQTSELFTTFFRGDIRDYFHDTN